MYVRLSQACLKLQWLMHTDLSCMILSMASYSYIVHMFCGVYMLSTGMTELCVHLEQYRVAGNL